MEYAYSTNDATAFYVIIMSVINPISKYQIFRIESDTPEIGYTCIRRRRQYAIMYHRLHTEITQDPCAVFQQVRTSFASSSSSSSSSSGACFVTCTLPQRDPTNEELLRSGQHATSCVLLRITFIHCTSLASQAVKNSEAGPDTCFLHPPLHAASFVS